MNAAEEAGKLILNLPKLWANTNTEERRKLLLAMLDAVYVDAKKPSQLYDQMLENLQDCTPDLKRQLIEALDIKVYASTDVVKIRGVIPLELPTPAQTPGCLPLHAYIPSKWG